MAVTTTSLLSAPVQQTFSMRLLAVPTPLFIHKVPATVKRLPRNGGRTLRMRRPIALQPAMVPLSNSGVTPPGQTLQAVDIDATPSLYGTYVAVNEQVTLQDQDPVLNWGAARLGVSLRQTEDQLIRDMLAGTAAFINCTGGGNGDNPTQITLADVQTVTRTLVGANAYMIMDHIDGTLKFNTSPVRDAFFGMMSTDVISNLEVAGNFQPKAAYAFPTDALKSEWGAINNVRFLLSSIGSKIPNASALNQTVYNCFITGMDAYCTVLQDGYSAQFVFLPAQYSGPLAMNVTMAWKMMTVPRIQQDTWLINLRMTLSNT
jgi:N4-gp56 family major capsid protein